MASLHVTLMFRYLVLLLIWLQLASSVFPSNASGVSKPNCIDHCGSVSIPYPFGIGAGCFIDEAFELECNNGVPMYGNIPVSSISLIDGQMTIDILIASSCSNESDENSLTLSKFTVSNTKNKLISIGCDTLVSINGNPPIGEGCSDCTTNEDATDDGSCNGMGCCKTSIPAGLRQSNVTVEREYPRKNMSLDNPCSYAFVAEEDSFRFSSSYLQDFKNNGTGRVRVVVDWTIGSETCDEVATEVTSNACGPNTVCIPGNNDTQGYRCNCKSGYAGNPYLPYVDANTTGYCQETVKCNDNSISGCSIPPPPPLPSSEISPLIKVNKIVAG
ncbi:hypothetical protein MKW98_014986 [Papaver atlanticum]|uniref:Uncharacterized protein n=1 Tax=Papaver atlanticum TaxID=357466 RepID=A0AAD4SMG8_9MAGN|nr:hypothetical protein MKW98_014986 [Papaver atlanticum]